METPTKNVITSETALKSFSAYLLTTGAKGTDEHERIMKEDQGFSARETETEVITLQREHLCNWKAEAKWNDQKKKGKKGGGGSEDLEVCSGHGVFNDLFKLKFVLLPKTFDTGTKMVDPKMNAALKPLPEVWNSLFLPRLFFPRRQDFFHACFPCAARRRLLLPGNRHNNDTGALSRPAFVVFPSSLQ